MNPGDRTVCACGAGDSLTTADRPADSLQRLYLRIASGQIAFLKFILEGYDGLAVLSTMDADTGLVRLLYPASRGRELFRLLDALAPGLTDFPA